MKRTLISLIGLVIFAGIMPAQARDADLGVSISDGRLRDFYLAIV
jgi:hypothetical protein